MTGKQTDVKLKLAMKWLHKHSLNFEFTAPLNLAGLWISICLLIPLQAHRDIQIKPVYINHPPPPPPPPHLLHFTAILNVWPMPHIYALFFFILCSTATPPSSPKGPYQLRYAQNPFSKQAAINPGSILHCLAKFLFCLNTFPFVCFTLPSDTLW